MVANVYVQSAEYSIHANTTSEPELDKRERMHWNGMRVYVRWILDSYRMQVYKYAIYAYMIIIIIIVFYRSENRLRH